MLKLTKKADYGLIALRHLAVAKADAGSRSSASAKDIADSYGIPLPLLSKVLQQLAREASNICALEAIRVIDGPIILTKCFTEHAGCDQTALCPVREPLRKVHEGILRLLANISLSDLASEEMQIPSVRPPLQNIQL